MSDVASHDARLTEELACKVMGWKSAPGRFCKSGRSWIPRWRFRPLEELADAFQLLDVAASRYKLVSSEGETFTAEVRVHGRMGKASGESEARTITIAISRALGLAHPNEVSAPSSKPVVRRSPRSRRGIDGI
jgi:hypothetical protein